MRFLIYCLTAILCANTISGCRALRTEKPGIFYDATFKDVSSDICERMADVLHSELGLNPEGRNQYVPGIRCQSWLRAADHSLVVLQLNADTLFIGALRNRYGEFLRPDASTRTLADSAIRILTRTYPMAVVEPRKEYEPWPF
jgi:hypothetical protein